MNKKDGVFNIIKKNSEAINKEDAKGKSLNSRKGKKGELEAALYLSKEGYEIVEVNYNICNFEIDIICKDKDTYVFVEVKYKTSKKYGMGFEEVNKNKQKKIISCAKLYMRSSNLNSNSKIRFDIISIDEGKVMHIKNAFSDI